MSYNQKCLHVRCSVGTLLFNIIKGTQIIQLCGIEAYGLDDEVTFIVYWFSHSVEAPFGTLTEVPVSLSVLASGAQKYMSPLLKLSYLPLVVKGTGRKIAKGKLFVAVSSVTQNLHFCFPG